MYFIEYECSIPTCLLHITRYGPILIRPFPFACQAAIPGETG